MSERGLAITSLQNRGHQMIVSSGNSGTLSLKTIGKPNSVAGSSHSSLVFIGVAFIVPCLQEKAKYVIMNR